MATRILVVDDYLPWQRFVLETFESEADFDVVSFAMDGVEAVQKAEELQPDLILMDITLLSLNGFETTRKIRVVSPASKVIFLTEHQESDLVQVAFEVGGSGYIVKSDSVSELVPGIRAVLRGQQFVSHSLEGWGENPSRFD
jgi:DNA-binding NarL/FixJ family response regulator